MIIYYNKKRIKLENYKIVNTIGKYFGLMFKSRNTKNLIFAFDREVKMAIHSYFVFFKFLAVWVDENNRVLETKIVSPFTSIVRPKKQFRKLIEIPLNSENNKLVRFFVGKRKI